MPRLAHAIGMRTHGVRPSEKNAFRLTSGLAPLGHPSRASPPRGGAGSARPHENALASPWYAPARPPGVRSPFDDHALSRVRVRPCHPGAETAPLRENHPPRCPRISPEAIFPGSSPRGGAGSARPQARHQANPNIASFRPPASRQHVRSHDVPRLSPSLRSRTRRAHPSEKTTSPLVSGFSPQGHFTLARPPEGRALHAR
jgi:hypothetical protein